MQFHLLSVTDVGPRRANSHARHTVDTITRCRIAMTQRAVFNVKRGAFCCQCRIDIRTSHRNDVIHSGRNFVDAAPAVTRRLRVCLFINAWISHSTFP